ncbi:hypothetical protein V6Z12_D11G155900 [Gossypium hirsutum]
MKLWHLHSTNSLPPSLSHLLSPLRPVILKNKVKKKEIGTKEFHPCFFFSSFSGYRCWVQSSEMMENRRKEGYFLSGY